MARGEGFLFKNKKGNPDLDSLLTNWRLLVFRNLNSKNIYFI